MSAFEAYDFADNENDGILREDKNGTLCVCISLYGSNKWEPLSELSATSWMNYRYKIREGLERIRKRTRKNKIELQKANITSETMYLFDEIYKKLSKGEKIEFLKKHKDTWLGKSTCTSCLDRCDDKKSCLHSDCSGMCNKCAETLESCENCPACSKKQEIQCPICQENKKIHDLSRSATCTHSVCWKCYGLAFQAGHPIENCPLCRATFTERKNRETQYQSDSSNDDDVDFNDTDNDIIESLEADMNEELSDVPNFVMDQVNNAILSQGEISFILRSSADSIAEHDLEHQIAVNLSNGIISL